jgi:hypothetical protein
VSVSIPILTIFSLSVWSPPCSDGFTMLLPIRLRKLSAKCFFLFFCCVDILGVLPDQRAALPNLDFERQPIFNFRCCLYPATNTTNCFEIVTMLILLSRSLLPLVPLLVSFFSVGLPIASVVSACMVLN